MVTYAPAEAQARYRDDETPAERRARHLRNLEELAEIGLDAARDLRAQIKAQTEAVVAGRAQPDPVAADKLALGLSRASRSVRLTYALIDRIDRAEARAAAARASAAPEAPADAPAPDAPPAEPDPASSKCGGMFWMNDRLVKLPPLSAYRPEQIAQHKARSLQDRIFAQETRRAEARKQIVEDTVEASIETEARESGTETEIHDRCERLYARIDELAKDEVAAYDFLNYPIIEMVERVCKDLGVRFDPDRWRDADWAIADAKEPHEMAAFLAAADPRRLVIRCANGRVFLRGQPPPPNNVLPKLDPPPKPDG
jgi:hypothetical protein